MRSLPMTTRPWWGSPLGLLLLAACSLGGAGCPARAREGTRDTGLLGLSLTKLAPQTLLRGSHVSLTGRSFVDSELGTAELVLSGTLDDVPFDMRRPAAYVNSSELGLEIDDDFLAELGGAPTTQRAFQGTATIEYLSTVDGQRHRSAALPIALAFQKSLDPDVFAVGDGVIYVNQPILVDGNRLLLGTGEGKTEAVLAGCFTPAASSTCGSSTTKRLPVTPLDPTDRTRGSFVYSSTVSGIGPGSFAGKLHLENTHKDGTIEKSPDLNVTFDVQPPTLDSASTTAASLGQYVVLQGGGFVGGNTDESTTLELVGTFTPDTGDPLPLDLVLVPEFRSGLELRYVLDDRDALGELIDLRKTTGTIAGTVQVVVEQGGTTVRSAKVPVQLSILSIKQVVYIRFLDEYVSALRRFGLRAADPLIQNRVLTVAARDYEGVNIEFRTEVPDDFAVYSQVDISGLDPSGGHSFGFDNTPGKDTDNQRLYDRIGGVNAVTQQNDGVAGYGGVFLDSFFLFSTRPPDPLYDNIRKSDLWQQMRVELFDELFDPFRADRGGAELTAVEIEALQPPTLTSGESCPAAKGDRRMAAACAIFAFGNLIGTTMTHEIGHSLGLADPYGSSFHDPGDQPNRLMDSGGSRSFNERVELNGEGPSVFCDDEYDYLRKTLPSLVAPPDVTRPNCF